MIPDSTEGSFQAFRNPLPTPASTATASRSSIRAEIGERGGWIGFARYMGWRCMRRGSATTWRAQNWDVTAISSPRRKSRPLFGQTLAQQVAQAMDTGLEEISRDRRKRRAVAASAAEELERLGRLPLRYLILEASADLPKESRHPGGACLPCRASPG